MFNGYSDQVASLYTGMDLKKILLRQLQLLADAPSCAIATRVGYPTSLPANSLTAHYEPSTLIALKTLVWIACLAPVCWLVWGAITNNLGPDPDRRNRLRHRPHHAAPARHHAGHLAAAPPLPRLTWLIKFRRLLGLFAFFYATLHMLT